MGTALTAAEWRQGARWLGRNSVWPYLFIFGMVLMGFGGVRAGHVLNCRDWPTATGEVVASELVRGLMREGVAKAGLEITYAYSVGAASYEGHRISYAGNKAGYEAIRTMLKQYRQGSTVTVYHHPGNPALAVLDPTFDWRALLPLFYGVGFVTVSTLGFFRRWRLTSANWFDGLHPEATAGRMRFEDFLLGFLGLLTILGIPFLWWALIKMYAGH